MVSMLSGWPDRERQAFESAQRIVVAPPHRSGDFDRASLVRQRRHHDFSFKACDQLPDAHVYAGTVAHVP